MQLIRAFALAAALALPAACVSVQVTNDGPAQLGAPSEHVAHNGDVALHYTARGPEDGALVVLLHGFPDYSASWDGLAWQLAQQGYRTVQLDQRGYNGSSAPEGVANYAMPILIADVEAAAQDARPGAPFVLIGHDWGAAIAWQYAMAHPDRVRNLVILSVPHPAGFAREMATNVEQQRNSEYARNFQRPGAEAALTAEGLADWVPAALKPQYIAAFQRSNFTAMLNYYRANYPSGTGAAVAQQAAATQQMPLIQAPTLVIHGLNDQALNAAGHSGTWNYVAKDTTLLMIPGAGHWV